MRSAVIISLLITGATFAQATFDLSTPVCSTTTFPTGCGATGDPEGISWNGILSGFFPFGATVDGTPNALGFPCGGTQYARVACGTALSGYTSPAGGPAPDPGPTGVVQMYIPIPAGSNNVSFCWQFYNNEGSQSFFNDGMSIDIVGPGCSPSITNLVYVDTYTTMTGLGIEGGGCPDIGGSQQIAPGGPQTFLGGLGAYPAGAQLRVMCWNGVDNAVSGQGLIDDVQFFSGPLPCQLFFSSPFGSGSIQMDNTPCATLAGAQYINAITLVPGTFPGGWFFGLDIPFTQLVGEVQTGFPFTGILDPAGASSFLLPGGVPSGLQLWAVSAQFAPGFGPFLFARPPVTYTVP